MNSKRIGNIGEAIVLAKFVEKGIPVYLPFGDNEKSDMIIQLNGQLLKVQVKTSDRLVNGSLIFNTCSTRGMQSVSVHYTKEDIDLYALYSLQTKEVYLISILDCPKDVICLRIEESKNNQSKGIRFAKDYAFDKIII